MLKSWSIQNFKPILDSGELQLKPVTILAGRNSSGKSSLIQSILMIAQTLADPLPEPALKPHASIVQLGTLDDVLCEFSDSRTISIQFELSHKVSIRGIYDEWTHKFIGIFDVGERGKSFSAIEGPEATLQSLSLKSDYLRYGILNEIPDEDIEELFSRESFTEEDRIMNYLSQSDFDAHYDLIVNKLSEADFSTFIENISLKSRILVERILKNRKPIYLGKSNSPYYNDIFGDNWASFGDLNLGNLPFDDNPGELHVPGTTAKINLEHQKEMEVTSDASSRKEEMPGQFLVTLSHFLPIKLVEIFYKQKGSEEPDFSREFNVMESAEEITRFFTTQIRYLGPLRADSSTTRRSFAPTSQLDDVGFKGEYAAVVYHYNQSAQIDWYNPNTGQNQQGTLREALDVWANYLDIASQVTTEAAGDLGVAWRVEAIEFVKPPQSKLFRTHV